MIASTPMTPPALLRYRERHVIRVIKDWGDDFRSFIEVCENDGIRVYPVSGGYRHDASEVKDLVARERGEGVAW